MDNTTVAMGGGGCRPMFTALQWQELEHQALIFKYMMAGIPVPPDLLLPIRKSFEAMAARFYHHPTMGYCSLYGKKVDPEPGRCRRTDGKKWRCSKDAYPDSKYCERHMHRGRNRSRKLVETQTLFQSHSQSSSSTVTNPTSNDRCNVVSGGTRESFPRSIPVQSIAASHAQTSDSGPNLTQLQMDRGSYSVMDRKDYRYLNVVKSEKDEHSIFSGATSANPRGLGIDPSTDNTWHMIPSQVDLFPLSKGRNESIMPINNTQLHSLHGLEQDPMNSLSRQHQHCLFGNEFGCTDGIKQENQSLQLFFDEWPKARDSWSELKHERSNRTSFSTTQLSMSIPMASSDFSTTSSRSPNGTQPSSILKKIDE